MPAAEGKEAALQLAAGVVRLELVANREAQKLSPPQCRRKLSLGSTRFRSSSVRAGLVTGMPLVA